MNNFSVKLNKKKFGLIILSVVVIGILFTVSSQPETIPLNSSLEENIDNIFSPEGRVYGTINISGMPLLGSADALLQLWRLEISNVLVANFGF